MGGMPNFEGNKMMNLKFYRHWVPAVCMAVTFMDGTPLSGKHCEGCGSNVPKINTNDGFTLS